MSEMGAINQDQIIISLIDRIGRLRALTDDESVMLERLIRKSGENRRRDRPWTPKEDRKVRKLMVRVQVAHAGARFRSNDNVRKLAEELNRTPETIRWRINKLRKMDKTSNAQDRVEG